jgi:hypothetical protein
MASFSNQEVKEKEGILFDTQDAWQGLMSAL